MENTPAPCNDQIQKENFKLILVNKPNNLEYILEICLYPGKIIFQAVNNIGTNISNYQSTYDFNSLIQIDKYFEPCKEIDKIYNFIIRLKNNNSLSIIKENDNIFLCLIISQPIEFKIKIPLMKADININSLILLLDEKDKKIKILEEKIEKNDNILREKIIKQNIKGYSQNLSFIEKEIEKQLNKIVISYKLLYNAKKDGDKAQNFHSKCDNIENTLIIIKSNTGKTFGGFTTQNWNSIGNYKNDKNAFVFSIDNQKIYNIINNEEKFAIYAHQSYGPCFGKGTDFGLYDECMGKNNNWSYNKNTYNFNNDNMNGGQNFGVLDYEVYQVILE